MWQDPLEPDQLTGVSKRHAKMAWKGLLTDHSFPVPDEAEPEHTDRPFTLPGSGLWIFGFWLL